MTPYTNKTAYTLTSTALLLIILVVLSEHGRSSRIFTPGHTDIAISSPDEAYAIWKGKGLRGRTLVLFDGYPHIRGRAGYEGPPRLTAANVIEFSVFENIVRKIYFIVPDAAWPEFLRQERMRPIRAVHGLERGLFLYNLIGIPLIATTPSSLPPIDEETLIYVNATAFDPQHVRDLVAQKGIRSDISIVLQDRRP